MSTAAASPTSLTEGDAGRTRRIDALDVVRGFALCGILFVNVPPLIGLWASTNPSSFVRLMLDLFVQERFFPIFSILFGLGFGLMWRTAASRSGHPRVALMRRLLVLLALGIPHQYFHNGEALLPYALVGLAFLMPMTLLRGRAAVIVPLVLGVVALGAALVGGGSVLLVPGLFLLGFTAGHAGWIPRIVDATRVPAVVAVTTAGAAAAVMLTTDMRTVRHDLSPTLGILLATSYVAVLLLLMHTPARRLLVAVLGPLGRMALTNYISATVIVLALRPVLPELGIADGAQESSWYRMLALCVVILAAQVLFSRWWLARFRQGPLEAMWRRATWGRPSPEGEPPRPTAVTR